MVRASPVFVVAFEWDILQCGDGVNNQRAMSSVGVPTDRSLAEHTHTHRQKEGDKVRDIEKSKSFPDVCGTTCLRVLQVN